MPGNPRNAINYRFLAILFSLLIASVSTRSVSAQSLIQEEPKLPQLALSLQINGFIPFDQSYRLNYHTKLLALPFELAGELDFPLNQTLASSLEVRYRRREAIFLPDVSISTLELEPGIRAYLEKDHPGDLRLFGRAGLLLARNTVQGVIAATTDGNAITNRTVTKDYYNIGIGLGLGIEYRVSTSSNVFFSVRIGLQLADSPDTGGLGDAGGLSLGFGYKYEIY